MQDHYKSKKYLDKFELPIRATDYFPKFYKEHLDDYLTYLNRFQDDLILGDSIITRIDEMCAKLIKCIEYYYEGKIGESHSYFKDSISMFDDSLLALFEKRDLELSNTVRLYRCRKMAEVPEDKNQLFHIPLELRDICDTSRFGVAGFPCLYLSTSIQLCLKELKARVDAKSTVETSYSNMYVSCFKFNPMSQYLDSIKVIDLALNWSEVIDEGITNNKFFFLYPIMFSCSIRRAKDGKSFVPEYIIPQMLLRHLVSKNEEPRTVFGIRYIPCYSESTLKKIGYEYNYVFPIDSFTAKLESGYSTNLVNSFKWTFPQKLNSFNSFQNAQYMLEEDIVD